jgi:hypothetical protein
MNLKATRVAASRERFSFRTVQVPMPPLRRPALLLLPLLLAACQAPPTYKITLKDGREYLCLGVPKYQQKTGYYRYRTLKDRDAMLRADEVLAIQEQGS